jgi:hypothetical protein
VWIRDFSGRFSLTEKGYLTMLNRKAFNIRMHDTHMKPQAPKTATFVIALILFLIGLLGLYTHVITIRTDLAQLCLVISNVLLILGILVKGL